MNGPETTTGTLIDVRIEKPGQIRIGPALAFIMVILFILVPVILVLGNAGLTARWIGFGVGSALTIVIIYAIQRHLKHKHIRRLFDLVKQGDHQSAASYMSRHAYEAGNNPLAGGWIGMLAGMGQTDTTIRASWYEERQTVEPLTISFYPILLDETEEAFRQLEEATEDAPAAPVEAAARSTQSERSFAAKIRRNVRLKGALMLGFWCFFFLNAATEAYQLSQVTVRLSFWVLVLAIYLFVSPSSGTSLSPAQWLLVPSGLILRKPARDRTRSSLHLFDRRRSVLCAYQVRKGSWVIYVADSEKNESVPVTSREARLLLRAWLSPLAPPPVEKLVDLT